MKVCVCASAFVCVYTSSNVDGYGGAVWEGLLLCSHDEVVASPWGQTGKHGILSVHLLHLKNTNDKYRKATRVFITH